ncbi:hypothetical protein PENTCL1PPCAC_207, partial [Pristionchus entomophagus]
SVSDAVLTPHSPLCPSLSCSTRPGAEHGRVRQLRRRASRSQYDAAGTGHGLPTGQTEYALTARSNQVAQGELPEGRLPRRHLWLIYPRPTVTRILIIYRIYVNIID